MHSLMNECAKPNSAMEGRQATGYEFGPYLVLPTERLLLKGGRPVSLTPKVFDTLLVFVQNSGQLLSKDELLTIIWQGSSVEAGNLTQNIFILRKVLGESPHDHSYLVTVPKRGYRFVAKVKRLYGGRAKRVPGGADDPDVDAPRSSLAVLPFTLLKGRGDSDQLGDVGMADTIITKLSKLRQLSVRPTKAILKYAGAGRHDLPSLGRELRVEAVLDGTIQRSRGRVRVNVQLIEVAEGATVWADQFDEKVADIFAIQDRVSERIVRALRTQLGGKSPSLRGPHPDEK